MKKAHWLLLGIAVLAGWNAGAVWLVQFSCYPLWSYVGAAELDAYMEFWQQAASWLIALPLALAIVAAVVLLWVYPPETPRWARWLGAGLQAALAGVDWLWLWPAQSRVMLPGKGMDMAAYAQLADANWVRIALVSGYAILVFWMLARCLWPNAEITGRRLLLIVTAALSLYSAGNVWIVHLAAYGLWPYVGRQEAFAYHVAWWHSIWGVIFIPAGIVFLGSIVMLWKRPEGVSLSMSRAGVGLLVVTYVLTSAWWGPLMARLATQDEGLSLPLYHLLMATHWLRVVLITAYTAVCCGMLVESATVRLRRNA